MPFPSPVKWKRTRMKRRRRRRRKRRRRRIKRITNGRRGENHEGTGGEERWDKGSRRENERD